MKHDMESCDQGGEDQDKTWLDEPVASVKGKLSDRCVEKLMIGFRIDGRTIKRGKFICISVI